MIKRNESIIQISPVPIQTICLVHGKNQRVYSPQVLLFSQDAWAAQINEAIKKQVNELITIQIGNIPTTVTQMLGLYEIKNNQREVLSLSISNYTYHNHAAHGMTYIKSLTFDLQQKKICQLEDLFKSGSDYVGVISSLVKEQILQREIPLLEEFIKIRPNQDFYIADKALVIYFQLYEITPYVVGLPMFPISVFDLIDIIDDNGPLGRMAVNN